MKIKHGWRQTLLSITRYVIAVFVAGSLYVARAQEAGGARTNPPVKAIAPATIAVTTRGGSGALPLYLSLNGKAVDLRQPQPAVVRALIIFHGKLRDADVYNASGLKAVASAGAAGEGTLLITPQFLESVDVEQFHLPSNTLRWAPEAWMGGDNALNTPVSSYDAVDALLARLGDAKVFPNLKTIVLAGHSGGGQVVQRYAVVGRGESMLRSGIRVRYVIANPSSYLYFSPERPSLYPSGSFSFGLPAKTCYGRYNDWKYGEVSPPPYVGKQDFAGLESEYVARDVRYLLGTEDNDPEQAALDKSCSAEDEGPFRLFRGKAYFRYLANRHPELLSKDAPQQLWLVPGVGHDGDKMLTSTCGVAAVFDAGQCTTRSLSPAP